MHLGREGIVVGGWGADISSVVIPNSQLLDLLLDVNDSRRIPPTLHFDLRSPPPSPRAIPPLTPDHEEEMQNILSAQRALMEAKQEYHAGLTTHEAYKRTERALLDIIDHPTASSPSAAAAGSAYPLSLARLEMTSHSTRGCVPAAMMPDYIKESAPVGFLSAGHEEEFLAGLDAWLDGNPGVEYDQRGMAGLGMGLGRGPLLPSFGRPKMQSEREREKEMQLRNPVSVFNWLADHKDRVVEEETGGAANSGGGGGGSGGNGGAGGGGGAGGHEKAASSSSKVVAAARKEKVSSPKPPVGAGARNATPSAARGGDAGGSSSARSGLKREKAGALLPKAVQDEEILDEDGSVIGGFVEDNGLAGSRGSKRKRGGNQDADDAYRPKGGGSKKRRRAGTKDRTSGVGGSAEGAAKGGDGEVSREEA